MVALRGRMEGAGSSEAQHPRSAWEPTGSPEVVPPAGSAGPMDALSRSFKGMFQVPAMYWAIAMVVAAVGALGESVAGNERFTAAMDEAFPLTPFLFVFFFGLFFLFLLLVVVPFSAATTRTALAVFRGEPIRFGLILSGFRHYGPVLGVALLTALPFLVIVAIGVAILIASFSAAASEPSSAFLWGTLWALGIMLVLFLPAFYLMMRWAFALFLVFDEGLGPVAALGRSWRLTQDRVLAVFVVLIVTGISGAVAAAAPPLLVFVSGWTPLALAELYQEAKSGRPAPVRNWEQETWADLVVVRED